MSNFKHVETTFGELHEIKNVVNDEGRARTIKVLKETAILRPYENGGKFFSEDNIFILSDNNMFYVT